MISFYSSIYDGDCVGEQNHANRATSNLYTEDVGI